MSPGELLALGIDEYDGLLAAWIPTLDRVPIQHDADGFALFAQDGVVIDGQAPTGRGVKWWRVRVAADGAGLAVVQPIWNGAARDFDLAWEPGPNLPRPSANHRLCIRAYSAGPWVALEAESPQQIEDREDTVLLEQGEQG